MASWPSLGHQGTGMGLESLRLHVSAGQEMKSTEASLVPDRQVCEQLSGLVLNAGEEATAAGTTGERPRATVLSFRRPFPFWKSHCRRRALLLL